jgi:hypothetical protein
MRRQGRESAAGNLIPEADYPKTGYIEINELCLPWRYNGKVWGNNETCGWTFCG